MSDVQKMLASVEKDLETIFQHYSHKDQHLRGGLTEGARSIVLTLQRMEGK